MGDDSAWINVADNCDGYLYDSDGPNLQKYARLAPPHGVLLEIGGYAGKSACWLGACARELGTVLFSVDWHRGSPQMQPGEELERPEMVGPDGAFDSLPHFRANIRRAGLEDWVIPIAARSQHMALHWTVPLRLLFIDGGHDYENVHRDFNLWAGNLVVGGVLIFHDANVPDVQEVVGEADSDPRFVIEMVNDSLAVLRRDQ